MVFFFKQKTAYEIKECDWSSDVCSSDLFLVELDKNRKVWVDYSEPFGKEANYPEGQEILEKVTKDFLIKKPMLNSELQMAIQQVTQNQMMFNKNFESHVSSIKTLGSSAEANAKTVELLADVVLQLKEEIINLNKELRSLKSDTNHDKMKTNL